MKIHTLEEFAQALRVGGDNQQADFGTEILDLLDLEEEVAEPYSDLCADLENYAKGYDHADKPEKALEWLGDRSDVLKEIETALEEAGRKEKLGANGKPRSWYDSDDAVKDLLTEREEIEDLLAAEGIEAEGELVDAIRKLCERAAKAPPAMEYDL